jgi:hypothetical protein
LGLCIYRAYSLQEARRSQERLGEARRGRERPGEAGEARRIQSY